jgi:MATE family multidrug resistance protein
MSAKDSRVATRATSDLPALGFSANGERRIDYQSILALAMPLMLNSSLQAIISLTDTWFVGHISTQAMAGMASIYWIVIFFIVLFGGVGLAVQTLVAQAKGSRRFWRAGHAAWVALWGTLATIPFFTGTAFLARPLLETLGLEPAVASLALEFWWPRMIGAPIGVALWAMLGFFNGIARPGLTLMTTAVVAVSNAVLNQLLIFDLHLGMAGAAWATNASMLIGLALSLFLFLRGRIRRNYRTHLTWRPDWRSLSRQLRLGLPMGLLYAADLFGLSLFQLMQVRLGEIEGAATQIVMMLTSLSYMPGVGIAMAGTTLVGLSIGAGDRAWAKRLGNSVIALTVGFMGLLGLLIALLGPLLIRGFIGGGDPNAPGLVELGTTLLWIAAGYQIFDGLNLGSGFSLRGAGDTSVPAVLALVLSWGGFVPLAHMLAFAPGEGLVRGLPQFGLGAVGGWLALLAYVAALGLALFLRWRSGAWERIRL